MTAADDPLRQREARAYNRRRRRIGTASTVVSLLVLIAITAAASALGGWGCVLALGVLLPAISLPFGYAGYRLSRAHGLSRQTAGGWLGDQLKGIGLADALGAVAALVLLACMRQWPHGWPLPTWALVLILEVVLAVIFPVVLLPIFVRSRPLDPGPLADSLRQTASDAGVAVRELRLLLLGEKTSAANAMVAGVGPTVRIYVGDTLAAAEDEPASAIAQTRVVLAHELGHRVHHDVWRLLAISGISTAVGVAGAWLAVRELSPAGAGHLTALPAVVLGFSIGTALTAPLSAWYSRRREWAADRYAVRLTGEGDTFAQAFERLTAQNLMELDPPRLRHLLTASHPTPRERIAAARLQQE